VQYDEYDSDDDQCMNPTACLRKTWTYIPTEKAEQPQNKQNYNNSPQHEISPFERLVKVTWRASHLPKLIKCLIQIGEATSCPPFYRVCIRNSTWPYFDLFMNTKINQVSTEWNPSKN
jgi:hypothetical protein